MAIISDDCDGNDVGIDAYGSSHSGGDDDEEDGDNNV